MSINNFIPTVWSAQLLRALEKALVYAQPGIVNRDYEGEIQDAGDTVKINSIGDPTVFDYTKNTDMPAAETLTDATRSLVIDQSKGFNFQVDDVDAQQTKPEVSGEAMNRSGYKLRDVADQYVAALLAAAATNTIGSTGAPIVIDTSTPGATAYEVLLRAKIKLDTANVPTEGRWIIGPPWFEAALALDPRFIGDIGAGGVVKNAVVGRAAGFTVLASNNVPNTAAAKWKIVAGINGAASYAEQINKVEAYRMEKRFADGVKGLHLYGGKLIRPEELVVITADDGTGLSA